MIFRTDSNCAIHEKIQHPPFRLFGTGGCIFIPRICMTATPKKEICGTLVSRLYEALDKNLQADKNEDRTAQNTGFSGKLGAGFFSNQKSEKANQKGNGTD